MQPVSYILPVHPEALKESLRLSNANAISALKLSEKCLTHQQCPQHLSLIFLISALSNAREEKKGTKCPSQ